MPVLDSMIVPSPQWFLLVVRSRSERSVAAALRAKGFEVFLPMHAVRQQWSDRVASYCAPLFSCLVFCRFALCDQYQVLNTPNVFSTHENAGKRVPVPIEEITRLQKVLESDYPVELCDVPTLGDLVQLGADEIVRGVLVERGEVCRVAICLDSIGRAVCITVPREVLKPVSDGGTTTYIPFHMLAE